jgi:TIR domain/Pentapeptide repeats (8 copies)
MTDIDALSLLARGVTTWNEQRPTGPIDLTGLQIWNADLRGVDFHLVDFNHTMIGGSDLRRANLAKARLNGVTIEQTSLEAADLTAVELKGASLWRTCLRDAVLAQVQSLDARIRDSILRGADLRGAQLHRLHMHNCDLTGATLADADFDEAFLKRITVEDELLKSIYQRGASIALLNQPLESDRVNCADFTVTATDADFGLIVHDGKAYWIGEHRWDFFVSHVTEDKQAVAEPLARALRTRRQRVWLDVRQIGLGDSIDERISFGINGSLFGVVVLSGDFFHRYWTVRELRELFEKRKRVFVVLHAVDRRSLEADYPELRDLFTVSTDEGIDAVADRLIDAMRRPPRELGGPSTG